MKKVIYQMSVSVDGYFEGLNHELDWHLVDEEFNAYAIETLRAAEVLIMGRKNYELMAGFWPTADDSPVKDFLNGKPKLVFSRTLKSVDWQNSTLAAGSPADEIARLRREPGEGLLWVGGDELASSFMDLGLIDEVRILLTPVLLGKGHSVFAGIRERRQLKLLSTRSFKSGTAVLSYEVVK